MLIQPPVYLFPEPHRIEIQFETFNYISYFQYLFHLFLLVLRLLAGRVPSWPGVALHKIAATIGGGVSVAKVQHP
jgi:hypothetical protein